MRWRQHRHISYLSYKIFTTCSAILPTKAHFEFSVVEVRTISRLNTTVGLKPVGPFHNVRQDSTILSHVYTSAICCLKQHVARNKQHVACCPQHVACCRQQNCCADEQHVADNKQLVARKLVRATCCRATCCAGVNAALKDCTAIHEQDSENCRRTSCYLV